MTGRIPWGQQQLGHPWDVVWGLCVCICVCVCVCAVLHLLCAPRHGLSLHVPFPRVWLCNCLAGERAEMHFPYLVLDLFSRYCIHLS